jgi:hypothetical protein
VTLVFVSRVQSLCFSYHSFDITCPPFIWAPDAMSGLSARLSIGVSGWLDQAAGDRLHGACNIAVQHHVRLCNDILSGGGHVSVNCGALGAPNAHIDFSLRILLYLFAAFGVMVKQINSVCSEGSVYSMLLLFGEVE